MADGQVKSVCCMYGDMYVCDIDMYECMSSSGVSPFSALRRLTLASSRDRLVHHSRVCSKYIYLLVTVSKTPTTDICPHRTVAPSSCLNCLLPAF